MRSHLCWPPPFPCARQQGCLHVAAMRFEHLSMRNSIVAAVIFNFLSLLPTAFGADIVNELTVSLSHSFDGTTWSERGVVVIREGTAPVASQNTLSIEQIAGLRQTASEDKHYFLSAEATKNGVTRKASTFMRACSLYESSLSDYVTIILDHDGHLLSLAATAPQYAYEACGGTRTTPSKLTSFNSTFRLQTTNQGPVADTATYLHRLEMEQRAKESGQMHDNRSFFAKYWMYIVPVVIFLLISGASGPDQQR